MRFVDGVAAFALALQLIYLHCCFWQCEVSYERATIWQRNGGERIMGKLKGNHCSSNKWGIKEEQQYAAYRHVGTQGNFTIHVFFGGELWRYSLCAPYYTGVIHILSLVDPLTQRECFVVVDIGQRTLWWLRINRESLNLAGFTTYEVMLTLMPAEIPPENECCCHEM